MNHPLLDQLNSSIGDLVRGESVEFGGEWTKSSRQAYTSEAQIGSGSGPFVEGADFRWRGTLTSASPFSGIAFLLTADNLYWAKAQEVSLTLPVDVSLHAYAGHTAEGATFTARLGCLPPWRLCGWQRGPGGSVHSWTERPHHGPCHLP